MQFLVRLEASAIRPRTDRTIRDTPEPMGLRIRRVMPRPRRVMDVKVAGAAPAGSRPTTSHPMVAVHTTAVDAAVFPAEAVAGQLACPVVVRVAHREIVLSERVPQRQTWHPLVVSAPWRIRSAIRGASKAAWK